MIQNRTMLMNGTGKGAFFSSVLSNVLFLGLAAFVMFGLPADLRAQQKENTLSEIQEKDETTQESETRQQEGKAFPGIPKSKSKTKKEADKRKKRLKERDQKLIKQFEQYLTGATLEGHFTVLGSDTGKRHAEKYSIVEAKKTQKKDRWIIKARIQYGKKDLVVPVNVKVLWAGKTPVITLEKTTIFGLGTFSARVLFNEGMYSGTWKHDDKGGHLFGKVIASKKEKDSEKQ